ncbi:MAG: WD40/YVTN/BNR-like repeat-containing protein [Halobaculum sp.]
MRLTRREAVRGLGAALATTTVAGTAVADEEFVVVESPTGNTIYDVERTVSGLYAVAAGGQVLERTTEGWTKIVDGGPTGNGNSLYGADVTDDGERLWFVGSSGAIGEYDVTTGSLNDFSAPNDVTNNFNDVSVTGDAGEANVSVAGDSGKMYFSFDNGETFDSTTPGSGSNINAVDFFDVRQGHIVDGNKSIFVTDDGSTYDKFGIADANVNLYGVDSDADDDVWICGGGGRIFLYDGTQFVPFDVGDASLRDIEVGPDDGGLAVGGGGKVFQYDGTDWTAVATPTGQNLKAVVRGDLDVAVGASGTIIER